MRYLDLAMLSFLAIKLALCRGVTQRFLPLTMPRQALFPFTSVTGFRAFLLELRAACEHDRGEHEKAVDSYLLAAQMVRGACLTHTTSARLC